MARTASLPPSFSTCSPNSSIEVDLPAPGHSRYADASRVTGVGETFLNHLLGDCLMFRRKAFDHGHSAA